MEFAMKMRLKVLEFLAFSSLLFLWTSHAWTTHEFEPIQMERSLMGVSPLQTHMVDSIVQCAGLCCSEPECKSFSLDCLILTAGVSGQCYLFDTNVDSVDDLVSSSLCYVQRKGQTGVINAAVVPIGTTTATTTTEPTTTVPSSTTFIPSTTTTSAGGSGSGNNLTIYDIVYGPLDMCSTGPSSQKDFIVIASDGVYYYDEVADLPSAPCKGPLSFTTVFSGGTDLDTVDQVSGMLVRDGHVELYSFETGKVYKWQISSGTLSKNLESNYLTMLGLAGSAVIASNEFTWSAYRSYTSQERHFFLGPDGPTDFFMVSSHFGQYSFDTDQPVININSFNMNPWSNIPSNTVAVCGYTNDPAKNFVLIDSNQQVYTYELDHNTDNNNPAKVLTPIGTLQF